MLSLEIKWLLPWLLVAAGGFLLLAVWALYRRARQAFLLIDQLHDLNEQVEQDLLRFTDGLFSLLSRSSHCVGLSYELNWYGQPVCRSWGDQSRYQHQICEKTLDADLKLTLYWMAKPVGERWVFVEAVVRTLATLIRTNLLIKQQTQVKAQLQASRSLLFLHHDIKNLAQFIHLQQGMLSKVQSGSEDILMPRIIRAASLASTQADDILSRLQVQQSTPIIADSLSLGAFCQQKADAFGIQVSVSGEAEIEFPLSVLDTVLENIYSNAVQHGNVDHLSLSITSAPHVMLCIQQRSPIEQEQLLRIFEPLASQSREKGRGIGMYQCRTLLKNYGANIQVESDSESASFNLSFPETLV